MKRKKDIGTQKKWHYAYYALFGISCVALIMTYLSSTIIHYTSGRQFPINSLIKYPLSLLILPAEMFALAFGLYFIYTLFDSRKPDKAPARLKERKAVAILLPIYHEPADIVQRTIEAVTRLKWEGGVRIYLLDDSTKDDYKEASDRLADRYGLARNGKPNRRGMIVRRPDRAGYKAGNINNALKHHVEEDYFVILDADQAPVPEFLQEMMDHFSDPGVAFVQSPQYYENEGTPLERATKLGNNIFFHAQLRSKAKDGALPFCGTNVVVRSEAFKRIRGFSYYTATEDIDLGLRLNAEGYHGAYVPKVLAYGYGPQDIKSYKSQQYRWANGNLAVLKENWRHILFSGKFSLRYQIHTFFTLAWWLIGIVAFLFVATPVISLVTGWPTHHLWLPELFIGLIFINLVLGIGMIHVSLRDRLTGEKVTIGDAFLQYSLITNSMFLFMRAAINVARGKYVGFVTTSKTKSHTTMGEIAPNLAVSAVTFLLSVYALYNIFSGTGLQNLRTYLPISLWLLFYSVLFASSILFVHAEKTTTAQPSTAPYTQTSTTE